MIQAGADKVAAAPPTGAARIHVAVFREGAAGMLKSERIQ